MTYPLKAPYDVVTTPYGKRGSYWSCNENSSGGVHTGCDLAAPSGTFIYAPIAGQIRHRSYGSAFGGHQFAISPDPGQPFADGEVFFAHTRTRLQDGTYVQIGTFIGEVGAEGNVSGPHLHMEYHPDTKGSWSCSVHADPAPILNHQTQDGGDTDVWSDYSGKPSGTLTIKNSQDYVCMDFVTADPPSSGLELHLLYANCEITWGDDPMGMIRVKYVRDDGDATAYQDYAVPKGAAIGSPDTFLLTATHWESGEKGKGGRWYLRCEGGISSVKIGTRYSKIAVVA